jgi:DNA-binding response OmpR family regulator
MAKILVVGTSLEIGSTLAVVLEFAGHCCEIAVGVEQAAGRLRKDSFDLVLAAYREDISSVGSANVLEVVSMKTPVVFLSESAESFEGVADGTFVGPPDPLALMAFIQFVLSERMERRNRMSPRRQPLGVLPVLKKPLPGRLRRIAT